MTSTRHLFWIGLLCLACHSKPVVQSAKPPAKEQAGPLPASTQASWALRILGRPISPEEYQKTPEKLGAIFSSLYAASPEQMYLFFYAIAFSQEGREPTSTWLVAQELLLQEARSQGLSVSDEEVYREMERAGMISAPFAQSKLERFAQEHQWTAEGYREDIRRMLLAEKAIIRITEKITIPEERLKEIYIEQETKLSVETLRLPFAPRVDLTVALSDAELKDYLAKNEAAVRALYEASAISKEQVKSRHILIKIAGDTPAASDVALQKAKALKLRIDAGADFAQLAIENSEDGSASKGGDLGWASPDAYVSAFKDGLQALAPGQVSGVVKSQFGYHLIKLEERRPPKAFDEVSLSLTKEAIANERARAAALKEAKALLATAKKSPKSSLQKLLPKGFKESLYVVGEVGFSLQNLTSGSMPESLGASLSLGQLESTAPLLEEPLLVGDASYAIVRLIQREDAKMENFGAAREQILTLEKGAKDAEAITTWLNERMDAAYRSVERGPSYEKVGPQSPTTEEE